MSDTLFRRFGTSTAISLFSGAGGMDIGVTQAGFDTLAQIEIDPHCCDTLRFNATKERRNTIVYEGDIRQIDPKQLMLDLLLDEGELDLLCGGSPCQSFSQIGKQKSLDDERGLLLFEFARFARVLKPKVILMEQVKGLLNAPDREGKKGGVCERLLAELRDLGYHCRMRVVNAAEYGVPQLRERVFVVAMREGIEFEFPDPTHRNPEKTSSMFGLPPYTTVGDVICGLPEPSPKGGYQPEDSHFDVTPAGDRRRMHGVPEGSYLAKELHLPIEQRCGLAKKDTTKFKRMHRNKPANTLRCGEIFYHPLDDRYLTPREYMRIHGYPDTYYLMGPIRGRSGQVKNLDQHRQVANSVPPPLARSIAENIISSLIRLEESFCVQK